MLAALESNRYGEIHCLYDSMDLCFELQRHICSFLSSTDALNYTFTCRKIRKETGLGILRRPVLRSSLKNHSKPCLRLKNINTEVIFHLPSHLLAKRTHSFRISFSVIFKYHSRLSSFFFGDFSDDDQGNYLFQMTVYVKDSNERIVEEARLPLVPTSLKQHHRAYIDFNIDPFASYSLVFSVASCREPKRARNFISTLPVYEYSTLTDVQFESLVYGSEITNYYNFLSNLVKVEKSDWFVFQDLLEKIPCGSMNELRSALQYKCEIPHHGDHCNPIHMACFGGAPGTVIEHMKDIGGVDLLVETSFRKKSPLYFACLGGNFEACRIILDSIGENPSVGVSFDSTTSPLHDAALLGDDLILRLLLNKFGADLILEKDCVGFTPFHVACQAGNLGVMRSLIEYGGRSIVNVMNRGEKGHPFHYAIMHGHAKVVKTLWLEQELFVPLMVGMEVLLSS